MGTCYGRLTTGHQGELKQHTKGACFPTAGARRKCPSNDTSTPQQTPRPWRPEGWAEETQKCKNVPELGSEDARHPCYVCSVCTTSKQATGSPGSLPSAAAEKDIGLTEKGGQWQRLGAVSPVEHEDPVSASSPAKKPSTQPRRDRQSEDTSERKVTGFLGCNRPG